jgi:ribosomal-protein-serine acetyltransferase
MISGACSVTSGIQYESLQKQAKIDVRMYRALSATALRVADNPEVPYRIDVDDELRLVRSDFVNPISLYGLISNNRDALAVTLPWTRDYDASDFWRDRARMVEEIEANTEAPFAIIHNGILAGERRLTQRSGNAAEMGCYLAPAFQGKRLATRSGRAVLDFAFDTWGIESINLYARPNNTQSLHGVRSMGGYRAGSNVWREEPDGYRYLYSAWRIDKDAN